MANTGVLIELEDGEVKETSLGVLTASAGHTIHAVILDNKVYDAKDKLAEYGAQNIVIVNAGDTLSTSLDYQAQVIAQMIEQYDLNAFLATASATGKDLLARVAAIMDEPLVSDCVAVNIDEKTAKKSHFSGKTFATLKVDTSCLLCTVRPTAIEAVPASGSGEIIEFAPTAADPGTTLIAEVKKDAAVQLDLTEAPIVITGGRAIKAAENYDMLKTCAQKIGAAVGASRAAVDAGFAPHSMQVGQTGKTVSPKLYIACGVSGAVQHFAGMKTSKVIVAINEDKDAPIFAKCDYGIVGDIFDVMPVLTEKL